MSLLSMIGQIGLGATGVGPIFQAGLGLSQLFKARGMRNLRRPTYNIPEEVKTGLARRQQLLNAPSAAVDQARANIEQTMGRTVGSASRAATDASQLLGTVGVAQYNTNQSLSQLATTEESIRQAREASLAQSEAQMAGYRDKAFDINEMQPYQDAARTRSMLAEGGLQNISGALGSLSNTAGQLFTAEAMSPGLLASFFQRDQPNNTGGMPPQPFGLPQFYRAFNR